MTRREKELFAAAIRAPSFAGPAIDFSAEVMWARAQKIAEYLTFKVTDAEITAAVAVNLAGKGQRTTVPLGRSKSQERRIRAQKGLDPVPQVRYRLIQDEDCHWYLIRTTQVEEFNQWQDAMADCIEWDGHDFNEDALGGDPGRVTFPSFEIE